MGLNNDGKNDGGPAFPKAAGTWEKLRQDPGMSLRDWFAGQVIGTLLTEQVMLVEHLPETNFEYRSLAGRAYAVADAMLEARTVGGRREELQEPPEFPVYHDAQGNEHAEF